MIRLLIYLSSNYRLDNLQASFLLSRLPLVGAKIDIKRQLADVYLEYLVARISVLINNPKKSNYYCLQTLMPSSFRESVIDRCSYYGIEARIRHDFLLPDFPIFKHQSSYIGDFPVARSLLQNILCLPLHEHMTTEDVYYVCDVVNKTITN